MYRVEWMLDWLVHVEGYLVSRLIIERNGGYIMLTCTNNDIV